jgi:hypothetical protein
MPGGGEALQYRTDIDGLRAKLKKPPRIEPGWLAFFSATRRFAFVTRAKA